MTSAICTVNSTSTTNGVNVSASSTPSLALADVAGVTSWSLSCIGTDELHSAATITASLVIDSVTKTATFSAPSSGCALIFRSQVNGGRDINGTIIPAYTETFGVYVLANGNRLGAVNETTEGNAVFGWCSKINPVLRTVAPSYDSIDVDLVTSASGALTIGEVGVVANLSLLADDEIDLASTAIILSANTSGNIHLKYGSTSRIAVDSVGIGFFGATPTAKSSAYSVTNPSTDRALNVTGDTLAQVAAVLGTLIADLQTKGLIG